MGFNPYRSEDLLELVHKRPFPPFRIRVKDSRFYDIPPTK